jgi:hypothetical protein
MDDKRDGSDDKRVDVYDKEKDDDYSNIDSDRNNDKDLSINGKCPYFRILIKKLYLVVKDF